MRSATYLYALQLVIEKAEVYLVNLRSADCNAFEISQRA